MSREDLLNDLEYVKTLAEEGATTPLLGGRFGLMWGVLMTITFFLHWAIFQLCIRPNDVKKTRNELCCQSRRGSCLGHVFHDAFNLGYRHAFKYIIPRGYKPPV